MMMVLICGGCNALVQAGLFGMAARLPATYVQALMAGQGMGGVLPAFILVVSISLSPSGTGTPEYKDVKWSAMAYFAVSTFTVLLGICGYLWLETCDLLEYYNAIDLPNRRDISRSESLVGQEALINASKSFLRGYEDPEDAPSPSPPNTNTITITNTNTTTNTTTTTNAKPSRFVVIEEKKGGHLGDSQMDSQRDFQRDADQEGRGQKSNSSVSASSSPASRPSSGRWPSEALRRAASTRAYCDIRNMAWGVFVNFAVSLAIFPSVTANIYAPQSNAHQDGDKIVFDANPPEGRFYGDLFIPFYCFLLFNICDFAGRCLAGRYRALSAEWYLPFSAARVVFIPLFLLCNVVEVGDSVLPVVFKHVAFPILLMVFMAFSNGYLSCLQFMEAPSRVPECLQDTAGRMMCLFCGFGLLAGSAFSFFLHFLLCTCNPLLQ